MTERQIKSALILQATIKAWLLLKRLREAWKVGENAASTSLILQSAVKRWKARKYATSLGK
jgi:hypothetical protein